MDPFRTIRRRLVAGFTTDPAARCPFDRWWSPCHQRIFPVAAGPDDSCSNATHQPQSSRGV
jgi:hypothetical protein